MNREDTSTGTTAVPQLGISEWFRPGEYERVERVLADMRALKVSELRTGFSWATYTTDEGRAWYAWLLPRLAREVRVLPCFSYTPPALGVEPWLAAPPRDPGAYADFLDEVIGALGDHFEWVELWNAPNHVNNWDYRLDAEWRCFSEMVSGAAALCRRRGKRVVLAGTCPTDPAWLDLMGRRGVLARVDAVGVHGFPGTWEYGWDDWRHPVSKVRSVLDRYDVQPEVWITAGGYSTWEHDEFQQVKAFVRLTEAPVQRAYWYSAHDLPEDPAQGIHLGERHYHLGLVRADGRPKLLHRIWAEKGLEGVRALALLGSGDEAPAPDSAVPAGSFSGDGATTTPVLPLIPNLRTRFGGDGSDGYVLITGGAGFVGTNLAHRLLSAGRTVRIFDNLSRPGVELNLRWLLDTHGDRRVQVQIDDARNPYALREAVRGAEQVFHFAAQVAVTTSVKDPTEDFEVNLRGVLNLLEALRALDNPPPLLFTSTNKVYGGLDDVVLRESETRYEPVDDDIRRCGIGRTRPLDFHSPYGCSKGGADQYVLDYGRIYGLPTVVFRMSCIYGPHQFGTEDQGWVAHFLIRAMDGEPITLYGDGKQVRDVLFVEDLVDAMLLAQDRIDTIRGQAFNIGGGPENAVSLLEFVDLIETVNNKRPELSFDAWRPGDQRYYVSDIRHFRDAVGWTPRVSVEEGMRRLYNWLNDTRAVRASRLVA